MRITLFIAAALFAAPAMATNWVQIGTSSTGGVFRYDPQSVRAIGDVVAAWVDWDYSDDKTMKARSSKQRVEIRCIDGMMRTTSSVDYAPDGIVLDSYSNQYARFIHVIPDSVGETLTRTVCAAAGR